MLEQLLISFRTGDLLTKKALAYAFISFINHEDECFYEALTYLTASDFNDTELLKQFFLLINQYKINFLNVLMSIESDYLLFFSMTTYANKFKGLLTPA